MRTNSILLFLLVSFIVSTNKANAQPDDQVLGEYLNARDFFNLNRTLQKPDLDASEYILSLSEAVAGFYFNRPQKAIDNTQILLTKYQEILGGNAVSMVTIMAECYSQLGDYDKAASLYQTLIEQIKAQSDVDVTNYERRYDMLKGLSGIAAQKLRMAKTSVIPVKTDTKGLTTIPICINDVFRSDFVFDTGAGYSMISEEYAKQAGVRILDHTLPVKGFSTVPVKLGVADKLVLGDAIIENALFIISPDRIVFKEIADYEINGIIGLHAMLALREIQLDRNGTLIIPQTPNQYPASNLMIDELSPFVQAFSEGDTLKMGFDTGASEGGLKASYYRQHKQKVEQIGTLDSIGMAGYGGSIREIPVYKMKDFPLQVGKAKGVLPKVNVEIQNIDEENTSSLLWKSDGIIGQDFVKLFPKMILSFDYMCLTFE